ncbi:hypothetical protein EJ02DRAFT_395268 [Clathrospora elynae]|uniref:Uncharacterized protein n=1 Tax=Clathrospora elynae TaxID=706981 RepID=A0A6A5T169_9PLEO|nr:hypothetical protein EJ02DRAFT_395268 [Clathrospora elynae]
MLSPETSPITPLEKLPFARQVYCGHQKRTASKCGHDIHPSESKHTPLCPCCTASLARTKLDVVQKKLVAEGGLAPPEYMRDRSWNSAKKGYLVAKQRLEKTRRDDQLRWEREQAWDEAHRRSDSQGTQASPGFQSPMECSVCASMAAVYPTKMAKPQIAKYVTWWEQPGALAADHILVPRTPPKSCNQHRKRARKTTGSETLRQMLCSLRESMHDADDLRRAWGVRNKIESALRRKHGLGSDFHIQADFWDSPIPDLVSRRNYKQIQDEQRMAARRARGNIARPKPPRSSLSYSEISEEVNVDKQWVETLRQKEEREELERDIRKAAETVGYLYFVGGINGMHEWKEYFMQSDRQLVVRMRASDSETTDSSESEDSQDTDDDGDEEEESFDEMELDEK